MTTFLLLTNALCTFFLLGVIVMVQLVHYPLFLKVGSAEFAEYHARHTTMMGFVAVPMLLELGSSAALALRSGLSSLEGLGLILVIVIWISTFGIQVPLHKKLSRDFDRSAIQRLVRTNWIRTLAWGARSILLIILIANRL